MLANEIYNIKFVYCKKSINEMTDKIAKWNPMYYKQTIVSNE